MNIFKQIKPIIVEYVTSIKKLKQPSINYCVRNELLPNIITRSPSNNVRKLLNIPYSDHQTQLNQDIFALLINQFSNGFFIEIGANDGYTLSNTVYLEEYFGWRGILVEPNSKYLPTLKKRSNSIIVNKAITSQAGKEEFIDAGLYGGIKSHLDTAHSSHTKNSNSILVDCMTLQEILDSSKAPKQIDFISIDVEGAEVPIVKQMVASDRRFKCGCIEYNSRMEDYRKMAYLLSNSGYEILWNNQTEQDIFFIDSHQNTLNKTI